MPTDLIALAERVEGLQGPDREVDADIALATGWTHRSGANWHLVVPWERPDYTTSLDAAMTLVPEGWRLLQLDVDDVGRCHWMLKGPMLKDALGRDYEWAIVSGAHGSLPALALTAACLRARAASPTRTIQEDPTNGR
jgi:hypothetical protein